MGKATASAKWISMHVDIRMQRKISGHTFVHVRCLTDVTTCFTVGCTEEPRKHRSRSVREFAEQLQGRHQRYCLHCKAKKKQQRNAAANAYRYHVVQTPSSAGAFLKECDVENSLKRCSLQSPPVVLMQALTEALAFLYGAPAKLITSAYLDLVAQYFREFDFNRKRLNLDQR